MFKKKTKEEKKVDYEFSKGLLKSAEALDLSPSDYFDSKIDYKFNEAKLIDEFKEYCLSKPLKPIVKLNHLKSCVGGDALELIKNYTHGSHLPEALESR